MVPAASAIRTINAGGANGAKASSNAEPAASDSFEKTLKRVGNERETRKTESPAEQPATEMSAVAEAPVADDTPEAGKAKKTKPARETKGKRPPAQEPAVASQPLVAARPVEPSPGMLEMMVCEEFSPQLPAIELEPELHVGGLNEPLVRVCAQEIDSPKLPALDAEWSVQTPPIVVEEVAEEPVQSVGMESQEAFAADAQVGLIKLDPQAFEPLQDEPLEMKAVEAISVEPEVKSVFAASDGEADATADAGPDDGEPMEGFARWVEETVWELTEEEGGEARVVRHELREMPASARGGTADAPETPAKTVISHEKPAAAEVRFSQDNHPRIISAVRSDIVASGGTMEIQLDPPELGALAVRIEMRDGVITASFATSNDEATRMLSHSLSQLKSGLESQGISVDKIQVQQAPRDEQSSRSGEDGGRQQQGGQGDREAKQDQERREMLQRMWRRISVGSDPIDLTA